MKTPAHLIFGRSACGKAGRPAEIAAALAVSRLRCGVLRQRVRHRAMRGLIVSLGAIAFAPFVVRAIKF